MDTSDMLIPTSDGLDIADPDPSDLIAQEQEEDTQPRRKALVVVVTDHPRQETDELRPLFSILLREAGFEMAGCVTVSSKKSKIREAIETGVVGGIDLVITVGGTGVGPRDKTPEATASVLDQRLNGIDQALRFSGLSCGAVDACTSRGIAGVSGSTVVVNLADSRPAIRDGMAMLGQLVHHVIDQLQTYSIDQ